MMAAVLSEGEPSAAASAGPVTERGRRTRERLVVAAREVFQERGFNDTTMSVVATRAGVSHGTVYVYFESKQELLRAVVGQLLDEVGDYLRVGYSGDPATRIAEANLRYLRVYAQHARMLQVVEQVATTDAVFAGVLTDFRARHVARVSDAIRRLQADGRVAHDLDAAVSAAALSAMVEGYARHSPGYDIDEVHRTLTRLWLRALGLDESADRQTAIDTSATAPAATARRRNGEDPSR
jgi:AcrR family transcriptional regulator